MAPSSTHLDLPVICRGLIELDSQLEADLCVLKVLCVFMMTVSPFTSMIVVGLVILATCLVAKPTPEGRGMGMSMSWEREAKYKGLSDQLRPECGEGRRGG